MKKIFTLSLILSVAIFAKAQQASYWKRTEEPANARSASRSQVSASDIFFELDLDGFTKHLSKAASGRKTGKSNTIIELPKTDGTFEKFRVVESSVMSAQLAAQYPEIKSYAGQGVDDPTATVRFTVSPYMGLSSIQHSAKGGTILIDWQNSNKTLYKVYKDGNVEMQCGTNEVQEILSEKGGRVQLLTQSSSWKKTYKMIVSCSAEYGNEVLKNTDPDNNLAINATNQAIIQTNITNIVDRLNSIYEREVGVGFELVGTIIYYGTNLNADPWPAYDNVSDGQPKGLNEINQKTIDDYASKNSLQYDIGHNFNHYPGGLSSGLGTVCGSEKKAAAASGNGNGAPFFSPGYPYPSMHLLMAHEVGHQLGAEHTFSTPLALIFGAVGAEIGTGSTIMSYSHMQPRMQNYSDDYFHWYSQKQIRDRIATAGCGTNSANNPPPKAIVASPRYYIPKSTPFVLSGTTTDDITDTENSSHTFAWEQSDFQNINNRTFVIPSSTTNEGPIFRSRPPSRSSQRYFPQLSDILRHNLTPPFETIPSVGRDINFKFTVRDNRSGNGQHSSVDLKVSVVETAGPFAITSQSAPVIWATGETQTVTWKVANTNASPINCSLVNILLSTDGGKTYPIVLKANTANDGTESIIVPDAASENCRIRIDAVNNIFFDVSNVNFVVTNTATRTTCAMAGPAWISVADLQATRATFTWERVYAATYELEINASNSSATAKTYTSSNPILAVPSLTTGTPYTVRVRSVCANGDRSAYSDVIQVTPTNPGTKTVASTATYCTIDPNTAPKGSAPNGNDVTYGLLANAFFADSKSTASRNFLKKGKVQNLYLYTLINAPSFTYVAWIDLNRDGTFSLAERLPVKQATYTKNNEVDSIRFQAPATFTPGLTRARVMMLPTYIQNPSNPQAIILNPKIQYLLTIPGFNFNDACPVEPGYFSYQDFNVLLAGDTEAPTMPGSLVAFSTTPSSTTLSWNASKDNVGVAFYQILVNNVVYGGTTLTYFPVESLPNGTSSRISVVAVDYEGNKSLPARLTISIPCSDSYTITAPQLSSTSWSIIDSFGRTMASGTGNSTLCLATGCNYTLVARNTAGFSGKDVFTLTNSDSVVQVSVAPTSGTSSSSVFCVGDQAGREPAVTNEVYTTELSVYPNPTHDVLNITVSNTLRSARIISADGRSMPVGRLANNQLDVSSLPAGVYIVLLETDKGLVRRKFIKQ